MNREEEDAEILKVTELIASLVTLWLEYPDTGGTKEDYLKLGIDTDNATEYDILALTGARATSVFIDALAKALNEDPIKVWSKYRMRSISRSE